MHRYLKLVPLCETISDEEMDKLREEQRKRLEEIFGIPTSGVPGEENDDDESDMQLQTSLVNDTGDRSADGDDVVNSDELIGSGVDDENPLD